MMVMMMMMVMVVCKLALLVSSALPAEGSHDPWRSEVALRKHLFQGYDKTERPALNVSVQVTSLKVEGFEVKEDAHILLLHGALQLTWQDPRLRWRLEDHEDVGRLGVDPQEVWRPDLTITPPLSSVSPHSHMPALVYPDGEVLFVPPVALPLACLLDLTYWPYDVLRCSFKAGSWVHHGHMLNVTLAENALKFLQPSTEQEGEGDSTKDSNSSTSQAWQVLFANLTRHTQIVPCCSEPQVTLLVYVVVRRSAPAITWVFKTPVICLCVMACLVFLLPPSGSEKVVFGGVCVLLNILFLGFAATIVYKDPMHTPLIVQLVMHQVVLTVVSVVVAVVVMRLARGPHYFPLPRHVNKFTTTLAPLLCLSSCTKQAARYDQEYAVIVKTEQFELAEKDDGRTGGETHADPNQWVLLASVVDRVSLILYLAACTVTFIRFSSVL